MRCTEIAAAISAHRIREPLNPSEKSAEAGSDLYGKIRKEYVTSTILNETGSRAHTPPPPVPSVQDLRNAWTKSGAQSGLKSGAWPDDVVEERPNKKRNQSLGDVIRWSQVQVAPDVKQPAPSPGSTSSPNSRRSQKPNQNNATDLIAHAPSKESVGQPKVRGNPSRFEILFDGTSDAKLLEKRREAKIFALRKNNEASRGHARSKSAGMYRRREASGDVLEERSIHSKGRPRGDEASVLSAGAAKPGPADPGAERGYLYYHDLSQKKKGMPEASDVSSVVSDNKPHHEAEPAAPPAEKLQEPNMVTSPVASVNSKRRASSAGRYGKHAGSRLSNLQQIRNAIAYVCMAGPHLEASRNEALLLLDQYSRGGMPGGDGAPLGPVSQFIIMLFHSKTLSFRSIYIVHPESGTFLDIKI